MSTSLGSDCERICPTANRPCTPASTRPSAASRARRWPTGPARRPPAKLVGGDPLAWLWLDFAKVKEGKQAKDFFENTSKDLIQTLAAGGTIDAFRRAEFIAAGLSKTPTGYTAALKLPAKRADLRNGLTLHVPPADTPGSLPLLQPDGVIVSQSFHLDLGEFWRNRDDLVNEQQLTEIEKGVGEVSKFLPNTTIPELFAQAGPYHRFVAVRSPGLQYNVEPTQNLPAMAFVTSKCEPKFARSAAAGLRAAALLAGFQYGLKMTEETHDGVTVVSYRFPEDGEYRGDDDNVRFNFVPCFAAVGDSFIVASDPRLLKDLIPELKSPTPEGSPTVWRGRAFAAGAAGLVLDNPEPTITTTVLNDGVGLDRARQQVTDLANWVKTLGTYELNIDHNTDSFEVRLEWSTK